MQEADNVERKEPEPTQKAAERPQVAPPPTTAPAAEKPQEKPQARKERPTNCAVCNKSIKKRWFYKNGNYYCTKKCWKTTVKKEEKPEENAEVKK